MRREAVFKKLRRYRMKKHVLPVMILTFIFLLSPFLLKTVSASDVTVYLDGVELVYTLEAKPTIINDRTMVPIRETANQLGIEVADYNPETRTMTLINGASTIMHTLNTDFIIKDGEVEYYTNSTVIENRSLMPIRMLASAINAYVDWEDDTKSVIISTNPANHTPIPDSGQSGGPVQQPGGRPSVLAIQPSKNNVMTGEEIVITVTATANTSEVRLMQASTIMLASSNQFTQSGADKIFTLRYIPLKPTLLSLRLTVIAGDGVTFNPDNIQAFNIFVNKGLDIISIQTQSATVNRGGTAAISVKADLGITKVTLVDSFDGKVYEVGPVSSSQSESLFEFNIKLDDHGRHVFKVGVTTNTGYRETDRQIEIDVVDTPVNLLQILKIDYNQNDPRTVGWDVPVSVTTNDQVNKVVVRDNAGNILYTAGSYSLTSGSTNRVFMVYVKILKNGTNNYTISAYDQTEKIYVDEPFTLASSGSSSGGQGTGGLIKSVEYDSKQALYIGSNINVTVLTAPMVELYVTKPGGGNAIDKLPSGADFDINIIRNFTSDGGYRYTLTIWVMEFGTYRIVAETQGGNTDFYNLSFKQ